MYVTSDDLYLFNEGTNYRLYEKFGAHLTEQDGQRGTHFAVWAPNAEGVSVIGISTAGIAWRRSYTSRAAQACGRFCGRRRRRRALQVPHSLASHGYRVDKADPIGFGHEGPPKTASSFAA